MGRKSAEGDQPGTCRGRVADGSMGSGHTGLDEKESGCCRGCATWFEGQGIGRLAGDRVAVTAWVAPAKAGVGSLSGRASANSSHEVRSALPAGEMD